MHSHRSTGSVGHTHREYSRPTSATYSGASYGGYSAKSSRALSQSSSGMISVHSGDLYRQMMHHSPTKSPERVRSAKSKDEKESLDEGVISSETEGVMWFQPTISGVPPSPRAFHSSARVGNKLFFFGGLTGNGPTCDLYVLDTLSMSWSQPTTIGSSPSPRYKQTTTTYDEKIILIGGEDGRRRLDDVYYLDTSAVPMVWSRFLNNAPTDMSGHSAILSGNQIIVVTKKPGFSHCCETYFFSLTKGTWSTSPALLGTLPLARRGHSAVVVGKRMLVFGGRRDMHDVDLLSYNTDEMRWMTFTYRKGAVPVSKTHHTCSMAGQYLILIGGQSCGVAETKGAPSAALTEIYVLNTKTMIWHQPVVLRNSPPPLHGHTADRLGSYIFVFGGVITNGPSHHYSGAVYVLQLDGIATAKTSWPSLRVSERKPSVYRSMEEMKSSLASDDPRLAEDRPKKDPRKGAESLVFS